MRPLVVLRAEPAASATAARASAMGLQVRTVPLFEVGPVDWLAPDSDAFDGLVLTSANAIRHGGAGLGALKRLPVHAVGAATAAAARDAGFAIASIGDGGSRDMRLPADKKLLHLTGRDHVGTGATAALAVYEARAIDRPKGIDDLAGCVVAVHSPRAGSRLAELVDSRSRIAVAAISAAAAGACGNGWEQVHAAPMPNEAALLALAARLCESRGR
jgi:uroporphyrinogen-III synthase